MQRGFLPTKAKDFPSPLSSPSEIQHASDEAHVEHDLHQDQGRPIPSGREQTDATQLNINTLSQQVFL